MSRTWPIRLFCLSNLKYMKVTQNFYSQSLGNLEVTGVQKTACFAHMTSRSDNPEFNNPLEKAVDTFQRYNTVVVSMHKIRHFTPNILACSRIPAAYSTLLFTAVYCRCVWHLSEENVSVTMGHSRKDPYPCPPPPPPTDRGNFHPPGRGRGKCVKMSGGMWKQICARGNTL